MKRNVKLYNVILPIFFIYIIPQAWLVILPADFAIDSAVLLICFSALRQGKLWSNYTHSIFRTWLYGFAADIISALVLFGFYFVGMFASDKLDSDFLYSVVSGVSYNPFKNLLSFLIILAAVALAGFLIYIFNSRPALRKTGLDAGAVKRTALMLAIFTAPYTFFIPYNVWDKIF